ncbi:hypothetical protein A0K93_00555 [Corynebacterium sp. BCW_4722]|nr:hypothetical protein A0K93_00555 [Corynebacterium sp. BCW_4722]
MARDFSKQIEDANAALQRQIGIFNPESAAQVKQINDQLKEFGLNLVTGGALLILVPLVIGGIAAIADNCAPGGQARSAELSSNRD